MNEDEKLIMGALHNRSRLQFSTKCLNDPQYRELRKLTDNFRLSYEEAEKQIGNNKLLGKVVVQVIKFYI